jgi:hypothetical protein
MRPSRGMGAISPSKMPGKKTIQRKDDPNSVEVFKKGGWIAGAIKKPGALRKSLGIKEGQTIPAGKLAKAAKAPGKMGQRARLAQTLKKLGK